MFRKRSESTDHGAPFASAVPYAVLVVETTEGVRLVSNLVDAGPELLRLGLPVEVAYERIDDELTLPMFRPSDA